MTDDDKRLLTEFLGECWHEWTATGISTWWCEKCDEVSGAPHRLDFTDWRVVGRLIEKVKYVLIDTNSYNTVAAVGCASRNRHGSTPQEAICSAVLAYLKEKKDA